MGSVASPRSLSRINKSYRNRYRFTVRGAEYTEGSRIDQSLALKILQRFDRRVELNIGMHTNPSILSIPEKVSVSRREVLEMAQTREAAGLLERYAGTSVLLEERLIIRERGLTRDVAREIFNKRKDFRGAFNLPHLEHREAAVTIGLTDLLVSAMAEEASWEIFISKGHQDGDRWVNPNPLAVVDAEAAIGFLRQAV